MQQSAPYMRVHFASIKSQWEEDIGENIPEEQWEKFLCCVHIWVWCSVKSLIAPTGPKLDFVEYILR